MRWLLSPFILWWHSHLASSTRHISPFELTVNSGAIRGERLLIDGQDYTVFKGIPFAMPPVGYLRFQMPKEPAKWRGVMNATQYSAMCMQNIDEGDAGEPERYVAHVSEDCLYLNVFSPTPIVFVTFNYRLGPLGFASTGDSVLPGNIGLWDQIWALKWVKANAEVFGGDPSNILLMGHGTGAASASLLALSPRAEGLFQKVLLMSGSALQPGVVRNTQVNATWNMNHRFGCRAFNSSELLDCARKRSKEEIFQYKRLHYDDYEEFVPIIDGVGGILPEPPEQLTLHRRKTPIVIGTTKDESSLRILLLNEKELNFTSISWEHGEKLAENLTMGYKQFQNHRLISQGCKSEYVWTQVDPSFPESVLFNSLLKMYSHFWYDAPASQLATYYLKHDLPVYLYSFDHISENFYDIDRAFHGVDKLHIFNVTPRFLNKRKDMNWQLDQRVVEIFSELVANFALYGTPTHENDGFSFNWTSTTAKELSYLSITDSPSMQVGYRWQGHVFWNWYARSLDAVDVGNIQRIAQLDRDFATAMLSFCSLFFFAILVGLACYCTRKESDEDEL
ncbi:hypothetical protein GCK72_024693 [Caenorhabditis remanei]|uniref:Carboxylesterase type B domain-containing protein n=1 Tax=Caenorhabditis remanei TaxID=31234 RepID=A0A6A5FZY1_CAERE|nr:hypothetical protein GCK72_024693 [Caenorhabditis remanei]KAF1748226.1 hypothetical protein GCK72_024693 [Caenorhabditis remanei]